MGEKNGDNYTEISDRAILRWAEKSGLQRPKGYATRTSHDKPEMGFGMMMMDDNSIRRVINSVARVQPRNYVVMEVKGQLISSERKDFLARWDGAHQFRKISVVMLGEPPLELRQRIREETLIEKRETI